MKSRVFHKVLIIFAIIWPTVAISADLPNRKSAPSKSVLACPPWGESRVAELTTKEKMYIALNRYYKNAVYESKRLWTVNSSSNRYIWAVQASDACGAAIGYVSSGEVNRMHFWNCECYYARMIDE